MKHLNASLSATLLLLAISASAQSYLPTQEVIQSQKEFQDDKFGIFIHWGIYSLLGQGEWVMTNQNINYQEYAKLASAFYPSHFDAEKWVSAIKAAGAKYICITSRHHDGFSMFGTKQSPYNIVDATPFGRDVLKELSEECAKQGIRLHFYYSTLDWYREDYSLGRTGTGTGRTMNGEWNSYLNFMKGQLTELLTNYGKIGCIWLDGHWDQSDHPDFDWGYDTLYPLIHSLQANCLVGNNHHLTPIPGEDIQIFERDVPGENSAGWHEGGISSLPLETCQTMNNSWGYRITDQNYMSISAIVKYLVSTAGRNANLLLNIGPQPNGELPEAALERLKGIGEWLSKYGETIYGTRSTLIPPQKWGVVTEKEDRIWLHIFPDDLGDDTLTEIFLPLDNIKLISAKTFDQAKPLKFKKEKTGIRITVDQIDSSCVDYIIELKRK